MQRKRSWKWVASQLAESKILRESERQYLGFRSFYSCPNLSSWKLIVVFDLLSDNKSEKRVKQLTSNISRYTGKGFCFRLACGCCRGCVKITWQNTASLYDPLCDLKKIENEKAISQLWNGLKNAIVSKVICNGGTMICNAQKTATTARELNTKSGEPSFLHAITICEWLFLLCLMA